MSAERAGDLIYLDASALVKLVLPETESGALVGDLSGASELVTSVVGAVETRRAVLAATGGNERAGERAAELLGAVTIVGVTGAIRDLASTLAPLSLRTLDAVHLATALTFGQELEGFVVYDRRLAEAARAVGLAVRAPGASRESGGGR